MAQVPVVAIGGILHTEQVRLAAACGVGGVCLVRALGTEPTQTAPIFEEALLVGRAAESLKHVPAWPNPTLDKV